MTVADRTSGPVGRLRVRGIWFLGPLLQGSVLDFAEGFAGLDFTGSSRSRLLGGARCRRWTLSCRGSSPFAGARGRTGLTLSGTSASGSPFGRQGRQENKREGKADSEGGIHHETFFRAHPNGAASATGSHAPKLRNALKPEEIGDTCVDSDKRSADNPAIPNYLFPILGTAMPHSLLPSYLERISHCSPQA